MYISCDFLPRPCLLGSFVITLCDLSMFILRNKKKKLKQTRTQFFKILLLIQPGRRWWGYEATWKTTRGPGKLIVHLFQMWGDKIFPIAKQVKSADEGTTKFNNCRDFHNKWRDGWHWLCGKYLNDRRGRPERRSKGERQPSQNLNNGYTNHRDYFKR